MVQFSAPRAILFDLDGTLDDRAGSVARYAARFHADFRTALAAMELAELIVQLQRADGDGYRARAEVCRELLDCLTWESPPAGEQLAEHWFSWFPRAPAPREGLYEVLQALVAGGIRLAIVTNGSVRMQQTKIDALGIERYLSTVVISEAVGLHKPDPAIFYYALAQIGCAPEDAWFVGDHPLNDVLGAQAAGLHAIWLPALHPWPAELPPPAHQITSLRELLAGGWLPSEGVGG